MVHEVKGFGIVSKAEVDVFLECSCFFDDPVDVGNLISGSSDFSKTNLIVWKFTVQVLLKPCLEDFEHNYASVAEKAMATHFSTLAWKIPWTVEPGRLQSMGLQKSWTGLSDFTFTLHFHALEKEMATHSSVLAWRIPGMAEPGGLLSVGLHRVGHD